MRQWIILPYDGSPIARAALHRAAQAARSSVGLYCGVLVATVTDDPAALDALTREMASIAGPDTPQQVHLLRPDDPSAAFLALCDSLPDASLAVPLGPEGCAAWYTRACKAGGLPHATMLFFVGPKEAAAFQQEHSPQPRTRGLFGALRRVGARLRPRAMPPIASRPRPTTIGEGSGHVPGVRPVAGAGSVRSGH